MRKKKYIFSLIASLAMMTMLVIPTVFAGANGATWEPTYTEQVHLEGWWIASNGGQFASELPILNVAGDADGIQAIVDVGSQITVNLEEFQSKMLPAGMELPGGTYDGTYVWGYLQDGTDPSILRDTYTGPVVVATRGAPTEMKFVNHLGSTTDSNALAYLYSIDQSLHWANPDGGDKYVPNTSGIGPDYVGEPAHYSGLIPAAVHLHGAEDPAAIDGGPDAWFTDYGTDGKALHGLTYYSMDGDNGQNYLIYRYPNVQEAAPLWFHDHTLGATRLNVYMGLAGAYQLIDPNLILPAGLAPLGLDRDATPNTYTNDEYLIPLVVQDRMFDENGELFYNSAPLQEGADADNFEGVNYGINPEHPYWSPEFFGDTVAVNGKVWPYLNVEAQRYRFLLINGSNARTWELTFNDTLATDNPSSPTIWQIGTDQGYLDNPVAVNPLTIMPGERAEFIIDFTDCAGQELVLNNVGPDEPFNGFIEPQEPADPTTTGRVMKFIVGGAPVTPDNSFVPTAATPIRTGTQKIVRLVDPVTGTLARNVNPDLTRELVLVEIAYDETTTLGGYVYEGGPLEVLVNNTKWMGMRPNPVDPNQMMGLDPVNGGEPDGIGNYLTELPVEGTTEVWEIVNMTMDAHPIHTHLAQFQLLNRQRVTGNPDDDSGFWAAYSAAFPSGSFEPAYGPPLDYDKDLNLSSGGKYGGNPDVTPYLSGSPITPYPGEEGWKDTVLAPPGTVTRFVVRWAPTDIGIPTKTVNIGGKQLPANYKALRYAFIPNDFIPGGTSGAYFDYVWHCHIIDHEDNEMMRPDAVTPSPYAPKNRGFMIGRDY